MRAEPARVLTEGATAENEQQNFIDRKRFDAHHYNFVLSDHFNLRSPEVFEGSYSRETGAIQHIPSIGEEVHG